MTHLSWSSLEALPFNLQRKELLRLVILHLSPSLGPGNVTRSPIHFSMIIHTCANHSLTDLTRYVQVYHYHVETFVQFTSSRAVNTVQAGL